ncbi:calpain family cysteine protease [Ceratobasidium sp. AG-Ba]|nr:calpain family cysteine protease [Ceratobasidium sp. AG-Ba]
MLGLIAQFRQQNVPQKQKTIIERKPAPTKGYTQQAERAGLLCTEELQIATERCRKKVEAIAKQCRARNRRFRDVEFDIEEDKERCLHGLATPLNSRYSPADVMRVSQIFDKPKFFIDGANWSDIMQGQLGDCWLLSALATVSTMEDLIEKICVARDEKVGVYGFIFYRDAGWVDVIIDDLLYTSIPKYEELSRGEKNLYHNDKQKFNSGARKGGQSLFFAKSGTENETWVPLLEKAYAKLHGDYAAIDGGLAADAIEDLTGGVSTIFHVHDILDEEQFWEEELSKVNKDRLFGCYIYKMGGGSDEDTTINGLFPGHAYSVISAKEVNGRRFLHVRNPWGKTEWTGAWSDGSKEWTPEWLALLPELDHKFGNDGEFLMEYPDFLNTWTMIERSRLFDRGWKMSSMWLNANSRSFPCAWNYGDVSFTFSVTEDTPAVIVLSQLDDRYFSEISGYSQWTLEFVIYRKGAPADEPYASSAHTVFWRRSINVELDDLEAGEYVVHVRLDRRHIRNRNYFQEAMSSWDHRKLSKVWTEACVSSSIAINFDANMYGELLPADVTTFGGQDLTEIELAHHESDEKKPSVVIASPMVLSTILERPPSNDGSGSEVVVHPEQSPAPVIVPVPVPETPITEGQTAEIVEPNGGEEDDKFEDAKSEKAESEKGDVKPDDVRSDKADEGDVPPPNPDLAGPNGPAGGNPSSGPMGVVHEGWRCDGCSADPIIGPRYHCLDAGCPDYDLCPACMAKGVHDKSHRMLCIRDPSEAGKLRDQISEGEDNSITLGLRVYTKGDSAATVSGQLRHGKVVAWKKKTTA